MFGFLIKKNFFDLWDNMFRIILLNLGFIISLAIPVFLPGVIPVPVISIILFGLGVIWCFIYLVAAGLCVKSVSDYGGFGFTDFIKKFKESWPAGLAFGFAVFVLFLMTRYIIPFYLQMESIFGLLLAAVIFWTMVLSVLSLQFFFTIRARLDTKLIKVFKKCFIIFFDNPGFAIFTFFHTVVSLIISAIFAFLIPGPAGLLLFLDEALRLRLMKYDWLEENPVPEGESVKKRRKIPWDAILIDEREKTGTRTFRNFIFPWKD